MKISTQSFNKYQRDTVDHLDGGIRDNAACIFVRECALCRKPWRGGISFFGMPAHPECVSAHLLNVTYQNHPDHIVLKRIPHMQVRGYSRYHGEYTYDAVWRDAHPSIKFNKTLEWFAQQTFPETAEFEREEEARRQRESAERDARAAENSDKRKEAVKETRARIARHREEWTADFEIATGTTFTSATRAVPKELRDYIFSGSPATGAARYKLVTERRGDVGEALWKYAFRVDDDGDATRRRLHEITSSTVPSHLHEFAFALTEMRRHVECRDHPEGRLMTVVKNVSDPAAWSTVRRGAPDVEVSAVKALSKIYGGDVMMFERLLDVPASLREWVSSGDDKMERGTVHMLMDFGILAPPEHWRAKTGWGITHEVSRMDAQAECDRREAAGLPRCAHTPSPSCIFQCCSNCCPGVGCVRHS
ncbi:hypothetical protein JKP88DRAFT_247479 [Tribonema minus]|uniref:Uncharacterized protein n=1 Tax=Tribonema minus TaxID=303371 RepID=A0A836CB66_9STRA|nr:hypothetical protein JKP88DRAFT_247479 [Tribonema minus]